MWKPIKHWENDYAVNENGDVMNLHNHHLLKGDRNSEGYYRVCLYNIHHNPSKQRFFRHRLVAEAFIPNPNNLPEVNHKDCDKSHNFQNNLEWITKKDNELHSHKTGSKPYKPFEVIFDNQDIKTYNVKSDCAKDIGVTSGLIRMWLHKESFTYIKYNIKQIKYINVNR